MRIPRALLRAAAGLALLLIALAPAAAQYPAPKEGSWIARDFRFHTGEVMPELRLHYRTVGEPSGEPVLILHGTTGSGASMLTPAFAGELFGPGQPLDASKYFIILPDAHRPRQVVQAVRRPAREVPALQLRRHGRRAVPAGDRRPRHPPPAPGDRQLDGRHAHLDLGRRPIPDFMDALVPMASQPTEMSSRNWMMRRLIIDTIRNDPDWKDGNYTDAAARAAGRPTCSSASPPTAARWPTRSRRRRASRPTSCSTSAWRRRSPADANDFLYQWDSSRDYNPSPGLERITGRAAGHQLRRRRAQSAGDRPHGARAQAREERPPAT